MASITHHQDKKTGAVYRYSVESYWDKEKQAPRNKQVYLGKVNPETGELMPSRSKDNTNENTEPTGGVSATSRVAGPFLLLDQLSRKHRLYKLIDKCFKGDSGLIMSLVFFLVHKGIALSRAQSWSQAVLHPFTDNIDSRRISELLKRISEDDRLRFLSLWMADNQEDDCLFYDITSISSYAQSNEYTRRGYNRDGESLEQINLAMLFGCESGLPMFYRRMPGNITDVSTLKTTVKSLDYLAPGAMHLVLDRGFYSISNIDELYRRKYKFTVSVPTGRKWVEQLIDKHYENIALPQNYLIVKEDEALYAVTELIKWGDKHRCYAHIYYNAEHSAADFDAFTRKLLALKEELESNNIVDANETMYEKYFIIKETPKRGRKVEFDNQAIQKHRKKYSGFFCIISNKTKSPEKALRTYRDKDAVENSFDDLKNSLDMKRLRVHSSGGMDSRLFLQFLALIYVSEIRKVTRGNEKLKNLTVRDVMEQMETLTRVKFSKRYGQVYTETTPLQRDIMLAFDVSLPA